MVRIGAYSKALVSAVSDRNPPRLTEEVGEGESACMFAFLPDVVVGFFSLVVYTCTYFSQRDFAATSTPHPIIVFGAEEREA